MTVYARYAKTIGIIVVIYVYIYIISMQDLYHQQSYLDLLSCQAARQPKEPMTLKMAMMILGPQG